MFISRKEYEGLKKTINDQGFVIQELSEWCESQENRLRELEQQKKKEPTYFG